MPRKLRIRKAHRAGLSASMTHWLMVGAPDDAHLAPARLPGWSDFVMTSRADRLTAWREHRRELMVEGETAGFTPFGARLERDPDCDDDEPPPDAAGLAWSEAFCREHGY